MTLNTLQTIPIKLANDTEAATILKELESQVANTPSERDIFDWAYWPTIEMAETEDALDEMRETGISLKHYLLTDMVYRLGEQLPDMAKDTEGTDGERSAKAKARIAVKLADRITALLFLENTKLDSLTGN